MHILSIFRETNFRTKNHILHETEIKCSTEFMGEISYNAASLVLHFFHFSVKSFYRKSYCITALFLREIRCSFALQILLFFIFSVKSFLEHDPKNLLCEQNCLCYCFGNYSFFFRETNFRIAKTRTQKNWFFP